MAGPTANYFTKIGGDFQISGVVFLAGSVKGTEFDPPVELVRTSTGGVVFGGGLVFRLSHIRVSPELRYTRWANPNFLEPAFARFGHAMLRSNQDQAEVLLGVSF